VNCLRSGESGSEAGRDELLLIRDVRAKRCAWAEPAPFGVAFGVPGPERVPGLRFGTTVLVYHNRDAPKPVPRHGKVHVHRALHTQGSRR